MQLPDFVPWLMADAKRRHGWYSDRELARHLGASVQGVCNWRDGRTVPPPEFVVKLAAYAEFPPERALIMCEMLRAGGKPAAIYGRLLDQIGGPDRFPLATNQAA